MKKPIFILFIAVLATATTIPEATPQSADKIICEMIAKTREIKTMTYTMRKLERVNGEMTEQIADIKLQRKPFKVYVRQKLPNDGMEVLFVKGANNGKALVNPNGFPWVNVNLHPLGSTMRKNQHHTILDSGYDLFINILDGLVKKYKPEIGNMTTISKTINWDGHSCWVIELNNPYFKYESYTVQPGETLLTIAKKFNLGEHQILTKNDKVDDYDDVSAGQVIQIPNDYSPRMTLYIDQKRKLPLVMKVYDDQGLYENYEYKAVVIDPVLGEETFSKHNEAYGF
ncbi:MAG: hypothetical protein DHS20C18_50720 [Saprospiraceae bacterium]|nr:MAG: hypothetical protein DHS20C18_50720 [Saprospiraceae bacterium]